MPHTEACGQSHALQPGLLRQHVDNGEQQNHGVRKADVHGLP